MQKYYQRIRQYNIRVNVIAPGLTDTEMMSNNTPKNIIEETVDNISLKRIGTPVKLQMLHYFYHLNFQVI